jgi:hypothetical protein
MRGRMARANRAHCTRGLVEAFHAASRKSRKAPRETSRVNSRSAEKKIGCCLVGSDAGTQAPQDNVIPISDEWAEANPKPQRRL